MISDMLTLMNRTISFLLNHIMLIFVVILIIAIVRFVNKKLQGMWMAIIYCKKCDVTFKSRRRVISYGMVMTNQLEKVVCPSCHKKDTVEVVPFEPKKYWVQIIWQQISDSIITGVHDWNKHHDILFMPLFREVCHHRICQ